MQHSEAVNEIETRRLKGGLKQVPLDERRAGTAPEMIPRLFQTHEIEVQADDADPFAGEQRRKAPSAAPRIEHALSSKVRGI